MRAAVIIFPGSNRERDVCAALARASGREPLRVWHRDADLPPNDLIVLPGTKATVADLAWLRGRGLDAAIAATSAPVLGICGGYQMMGRTITDDVESGNGTVDGLGWLDVDTTFSPDKLTRQRRGTAMGRRVSGYEIHHGRV